MTTYAFEQQLIKAIENPRVEALELGSEQQYRDHPNISNSEIGVFHKDGPWAYKQYKEEEFDVTSSGFKLGTMFEMYLMETEKFNQKYILCDLSDDKVPSNVYHQKYCARRIAGENSAIAYGEVYSTKNKSDKKIREKIDELEEAYKEYIEFKQKAEDKIEYNLGRSQLLSDMKAVIGTHRLASQLLTYEDNEGFDVHTQLPLVANTECPFPLKGMLDRLILDWDAKKLWIVDLKTTSKPLNNFGYWAKRYRYHRQLSIYTFLAFLFIKIRYGISTLKEIILEWDVNPMLIPVRTDGIIECRALEAPEVAIDEGMKEALEVLEQIQWHQKADKWRHRKEYYANNGLEVLDYESDGTISPEESEESSGD